MTKDKALEERFLAQNCRLLSVTVLALLLESSDTFLDSRLYSIASSSFPVRFSYRIKFLVHSR
jgi:hypothetical protein